jgi:hypothetical protein
VNAVTRRVLEMCVRVLAWLAAHPVEDPGLTLLSAQLQALVARLTTAMDAQRAGLVQSRASRTRKEELRRELQAGPIAHLARIGELAAAEAHELRTVFTFKPTAQTMTAFRAALRTIVAAAEEHQETLLRHGLSAAGLDRLRGMQAELEAAVTLGLEGRLRHRAATKELRTLKREAGKVARAIDTAVRLRFEHDSLALAAWEGAYEVLGTPERTEEPAGGSAGEATGNSSAGAAGSPTGGTPAAGGDVRPAA